MIYSGGDGDDDLIGGHTVPGLHDGNDAIAGDNGHDAILGKYHQFISSQFTCADSAIVSYR
jgi:Ca2+-binding RTX toxin-like protein